MHACSCTHIHACTRAHTHVHTYTELLEKYFYQHLGELQHSLLPFLSIGRQIDRHNLYRYDLSGFTDPAFSQLKPRSWCRGRHGIHCCHFNESLGLQLLDCLSPIPQRFCSTLRGQEESAVGSLSQHGTKGLGQAEEP